MTENDIPVKWYSMYELSDMLQKPDGTLKTYIAKHGKWLNRKKQGKKYLYDDESYQKLIVIVDTYDSTQSKDAVDEELVKRYGEGAGQLVDDRTSLAKTFDPYVHQIGELTTAFLGFIAEYKRTNDLMERRLNLIEEKVHLGLPSPEKVETSVINLAGDKPEEKIASRVTESPKSKRSQVTNSKTAKQVVKKVVKRKLPVRGRGGKFKKVRSFLGIKF